MRATVINIGELKMGKKFKMGYRVICFTCEDGAFAQSYIGPDFDNWYRWGPITLNRTYSGVRLLRREGTPLRLIDADSPVQPDDGPPCKYIPKPKTKKLPPPDPQGDLFQ